MRACRLEQSILNNYMSFFFFKLHGMVNRGLNICSIICYWIIYLSKDGSMRTGACILENADRSVPTEQNNQKGEGHEYGSMQTGEIHIEKNHDIRFFSSCMEW